MSMRVRPDEELKNATTAERFLEGGGEMGERIRAFDWSPTPIGPPAGWPASLRTTIRLMLNSQHPMFIWWGPELIQFYNDAYRQTMGPEMHPSALGARGRESWADIWPIIGPQVDLVMAGEGSTWNVEQLVPIHRHGRREDVWWTYGYSPIDLDDRVGGVLVVCTDVTEQHLQTEAFKDSTRRLAEQFEVAPGFIAILTGPDHVFELANASYRLLVGNRDVIGRPLREALPEIAGQGFHELLDEVFTTGKSHVGRRTPVMLQSDPAHPPQRVFLDFVYQPIRDRDGSVTGIFVEGQNVTDHVLAGDRLRLINKELMHRVKNTLAMVSAVAGQTFRGVVGREALATFNARLVAFSAAHDALAGHRNHSALVGDVVDGALAPHRPRTGRYRVGGPRVVIGSKQALSLALAIHELATNAAKYGALSNDHGRVDLNWLVTPGSPGVFRLEWRETGGPPVSPVVQKGFGSTLIQDVLAADFGADIRLSYEPTGVVLLMEAPLDRLVSEEDIPPPDSA